MWLDVGAINVPSAITVLDQKDAKVRISRLISRNFIGRPFNVFIYPMQLVIATASEPRTMTVIC